jgi:TatD DNase family protein
VPHRGKPCEPAFVGDTARLLAAEFDWDIEDLARTTTDNFFNLFTKATR